MKVFLPFKVQEIGGTSTFARKFQAGMAAAGHEVFFDFREDYDVLFMIVQCPFRFLRHAKKHRRPIVQRLDGTFYWTAGGWKFPLLNAKAAIIRRFYTDFSIYQSAYSAESAKRFLGRKRPDPSVTIFNGADLGIFTPRGKKQPVRDYPDQAVFFTASAFRRRDQLDPLLAAVSAYRKKYGKKFKVQIAGNFTGQLAGIEPELEKHKHLQLLGKVKNYDLAAYERSCDAFLFTHLNPPCPNNIIESLACGLPICGLTDGAMSEIVTSGQDGELLPVTGTGYWRKRPFNAEGMADNMHKIVQDQRRYGRSARQTAEARFGLDRMINQYVAAFKHVASSRNVR